MGLTRDQPRQQLIFRTVKGLIHTHDSIGHRCCHFPSGCHPQPAHAADDHPIPCRDQQGFIHAHGNTDNLLTPSAHAAADDPRHRGISKASFPLTAARLCPCALAPEIAAW